VAIYHLNANVISRARGQSIVAAAAYRSGSKLRDERYGTVHHYAGRRAVAHAEIMTPADAPDWAHDRELLWNRVEAVERRRDSQLARAIEIGLPLELPHADTLALVRDYVATVFVAQGMIADFGIHHDNPQNPKAHILLTLRAVTQIGFGLKQRHWNGKANLLTWRAAWAERANEHLARAGQAIRIDHRTLAAQQLDLMPARRVGFARAVTDTRRLPDHFAQRSAEQRLIAHANGAAIIEDPTVALRALTHQAPTFSESDVARFLKSRTDGETQFESALQSVLSSADIVALAVQGDEPRFTSRDMVEAQKSLRHRTRSMAARRGHAVSPASQTAVLSHHSLTEELRSVFAYLTGDGAAKAIAIVNGAAKTALLEACRDAWSADGWQTVDANPGTVAADEALPHGGRHALTKSVVLLVDCAHRLCLKSLERLLSIADHARAKVVLVGDAEVQAQMDRETPFATVLRDLGRRET